MKITPQTAQNSPYSPNKAKMPYEIWAGKFRQELERSGLSSDQRKENFFRRWASPDVIDKDGRQLYRNDGLVLPPISHRARVEVFSGMVKVKMPNYQPPPAKPPQRGIIHGMSRNSRKRMMEAIAQWANFEQGRAYFITLTYHEEWGVHFSAWKRDMDVFIKRLRRKFDDCGGLWKLEFQRRGAPHYHLIISGIDMVLSDLIDWITKAWGEIAHDTSVHRGKFSTNVRRIYSRRHAMHYAAKYMTKDVPVWVNPDEETGELEPIPTGRIWAFFGNIDRTPILAFNTSIKQAASWRNQAVLHLMRNNSRYAERFSRMDEKRSWCVFGIGYAKEDKQITQWRDFIEREWLA